MRVAFVTETWQPSTDGVVTRLSATVRELRRQGHQVLVIAPSGSGPEHTGTTVRTVPTVGFRFVYGGRRWGLPLPRVAHYVREFRPDVVHVVNPMLLGIAGVWAARRYGIPLVASHHTDVPRYAKFYRLGWLQPLITWLVGMLHRQATVNLVTSTQRCAELRSTGAPEVRLWRRGVQLDLFHPAHRTRPTTPGAPTRINALYVGRLAKEKDIQRLAPLVQPGGRIDLSLVGDGPDRERLARLFATAPVTFTGTLTGAALARAYADADVFVFPSTTETLGLVLLEALASGVPVVAFDTPASREIVGSCAASRLVPQDEPHRIADLVAELLATRPAELGAAARQEAQQWSWQAATADLLTHYDHACATARTSLRMSPVAPHRAVDGPEPAGRTTAPTATEEESVA